MRFLWLNLHVLSGQRWRKHVFTKCFSVHVSTFLLVSSKSAWSHVLNVPSFMHKFLAMPWKSQLKLWIVWWMCGNVGRGCCDSDLVAISLLYHRKTYNVTHKIESLSIYYVCFWQCPTGFSWNWVYFLGKRWCNNKFCDFF